MRKLVKERIATKRTLKPLRARIIQLEGIIEQLERDKELLMELMPLYSRLSELFMRDRRLNP
jgi:hypothetical protein